jgi:cytidine deaminase
MTELSEKEIDRLVEAATSVRARARAPYSGFAVGAAVLSADGCVHVGCNVENASYGLSVCAERHAVAAAVAAGTSVLSAVAVVTESSPPASPCGACRQVLAEFGEFPVILANLAGERRITSVGELLPNAFTPESLVKSDKS